MCQQTLLDVRVIFRIECRGTLRSYVLNLSGCFFPLIEPRFSVLHLAPRLTRPTRPRLILTDRARPAGPALRARRLGRLLVLSRAR